MSQAASDRITSVLKEDRLIAPPPAFKAQAALSSSSEYEELWQSAKNEPDRFWDEQARSMLTWEATWSKVLDWQPPFAKWFVDGKLNVSSNCLDRHVTTWRRNKAAIVWESEAGEVRTLTYQQLHGEVVRFANVLKSLAVQAGDRVTIYMPMVPEAAVAMLACARIGAPHCVVFAGFSAEALADRNNDAGSKVVITCDAGWRRGQTVPLKEQVDQSLARCPQIKHVIVLKHTQAHVAMVPGRDHWWHELMAAANSNNQLNAYDSEHPLFLLYTSGSTGKPKGILHTSAGYLLDAALTCKYILDLKDDDVYWCTADIGWVTGHTYVVYGPLALGATVFMYEGALNWPDHGRFWAIIERHKVSVLYTAPTAIRSFIRAGEQWPRRFDLSSLRLLGSVGEPINPEAWYWYYQVVGGGRCPVIDTWWQTETGSIMIAPFPGATSCVPGSATVPFFGVFPEVVDKLGQPVPADAGGFLVIDRPWPGMLRTIWNDPERYIKQYWSQIPGKYFTGDGARRDSRGYFWILGRIDDVINVSGHRLSTMEVESALVSHPSVAEAAVVGKPHEVKGESLVAFVTLESGITASDALRKELAQHVVGQIGALARPDEIRFAEALPKTRSGKIMRRLLRDIAAGRETIGDTTTLEDYSVLASLRQDED